ncbi:hypothetical protein AN958_12612 [Leucoagaricus sp. SymC.cos]|nr:hypothetical protein AN958_12612 [Leucoagaricus sp. SymC.cos]
MPIKLYYADGTSNTESTVTHYTNLQTQIDGQQCDIRFLIMRLAKKTLILGIPFLEHFNPDIDWNQRTFKWRNHHTQYMELLYSLNQLTNQSSTTLNQLAVFHTEQPPTNDWDYNPLAHDQYPISHNKYQVDIEISHMTATPLELNYKATIATKLAQSKASSDTTPFEEMVPTKFHHHQQLFSKTQSD